MFKFELNQFVSLAVSEEMGHIKGRAEYPGRPNGYLVHYKAADGRASEAWFDEDDIDAVKGNDGYPIYVCKGIDVQANGVVES